MLVLLACSAFFTGCARLSEFWILKYCFLENSFHCLSGLRIFCVWESCLGWLVPNCRVELFLCTPSAPWTNAWKTVWFGADFKPVAPQRNVVYIWGLWWVRGADAACTGMAEPREGRLLNRSRCHPCGFAMEVSATSSPWLSTWTPSGSGGPAGRQRWAAGGREHRQPWVCLPQPGLQRDREP